RRIMEETSGRDLAWFFQQWLRRAGSPEVEGGWWYDPSNRRVEIELVQTQPGDPYRLPLEVGVATEGADGPRIEAVEMTGREQRLTISCDREPTSVALDPACKALVKS